MSPKPLSAASERLLRTCCEPIQRVVRRAAELWPNGFVVTCGHRGRAEQEAAKAAGKSNAAFGQSPHNLSPAEGIDVAPLTVDGRIEWSDSLMFAQLAGFIRGVGLMLSPPVELVSGYDWDGDGSTLDTKLKDGPHLETPSWRTRKPTV